MRTAYIALALFILSTGPAAAYVGPGLGIGAIGAILGILLTVLLAVLGIVWYPVRRLVRRSASRSHEPEDSKAG